MIAGVLSRSSGYARVQPEIQRCVAPELLHQAGQSPEAGWTIMRIPNELFESENIQECDGTWRELDRSHI